MSLIPNDLIAPWTWENRVKRKERELADWRGLAGKVKPLVESGQTDAARKIVADSRPPEAPNQSPQMKAVAERLKSALSEMQSRPAGGIRASGKAEGGKPEADAFRSAVQSGLSKVGKAASIAGGEIASGARSNVGNLASAKDWALSEDPFRLNDIPGSVTAQQKVQRANPVRRYAGLPAEPTRAEVTGEDRSQGLSNAARVGMATVSGEQFVNNLAGKDVTSGLPTPVRYGIESFAAPVNLLSVGGAGIAAKAGGAGLKGVGAAVARRFVLEGTSDLAGRVAGEQAMKALPEDTPMPLKVGTALGAGILAGGATYKVGSKALDVAPGAARGLKAGVDAQGGLASESGQFSTGRPKDIAADMPYEGRKVIPDSRAASLDLNGDQVVNARGDVIGAIRSAVGIDLGGRQIPTKGFYFDAAGGTGVGHRLYGETPEDIIESLRFARTDNRYGAAADAFSAPAPLANERLWFHSTRDMAYDLPDEAKSVGGATGITQGPGVYLAADPSKSAGRYGNRTFVTEFDGNVLDLTRKMGPDDALFEGGPTWNDVVENIVARLESERSTLTLGGRLDDLVKKGRAGAWETPDGKTFGRKESAIAHVRQLRNAGPMVDAKIDLIRRAIRDPEYLKSVQKSAWSSVARSGDDITGYAYRDALVNNLHQVIGRKNLNQWLGRFAKLGGDGEFGGYDRLDDTKVGLSVINNTLADMGVDAVFHHSPRADGDVLIVLNGEKARVLGDVKDVKEGLKGKTWGELKKNIAKATKAAQDFEIQDTGDPRGLKAVFVREANGRWQQYVSGYVRQLDNGKWAASLGADTFVGSNFESAEEAAKQFLRGAAGASMTEYGYIRPQLATSAAGAAAGGLYGATNPEQGPYGDRVSSALLYAGLGALAGAVAGKGVDLYARRGQGYVPPITTPSGAQMVISDVGTDGITAAIVTKASVDRGPGALASKYAPVKKLKGMLAPADDMPRDVAIATRAAEGAGAAEQAAMQVKMKTVVDRMLAVDKQTPARYLGDVSVLSKAQKRLIGSLPDVIERPSAYEISPQLREAIDAFIVTQWNDVSNVARSKYGIDILPYTNNGEAGYGYVPHMKATDLDDDALKTASGASLSTSRSTKERAYPTLFDRVTRHPEWKPELDMGTLTDRHTKGTILNIKAAVFKAATGGLTKSEVLDITHPGLVAAKDDAVKEAASLRARVNTAIRQAGGLGDEVDELDKVLNEFDRGMPQGGMRPLAKTGTALKQSEGLVEGKRAETVARKMTGGGPVRVKVPPTGEALLQADAMDRVVNKFKPLIPDDVSEVAKLDTAMRRTEKRIQLLSSRQGVKVQGLAKLQSDLAVAKDHLDTLRQRYRTAAIPEDQYVQSKETFLYHPPEVAKAIHDVRAPVTGRWKKVADVINEIRALHLAGDGSPLTIQGMLAIISDPVNAKRAGNWLFGDGNSPTSELMRIAHTEADDVAQYTMATMRPFGQQTLELSAQQQGSKVLGRIPGFNRVEKEMFAAVEIGQFRGWQADRGIVMKFHPGMTLEQAADDSARFWEKMVPSMSNAQRGVGPQRASIERATITSTSFAASMPLMMKDAASGWAKTLKTLGRTGDLRLAIASTNGNEMIAMYRMLIAGGVLTTIAAASASLSAQSRGLSQEEAVKRATLPWGGTGWSSSSDWMTLQLGEGRRIGLGGPARGFLRAIMPDKDGVPFTGLEQWANGKVNQPLGAIRDIYHDSDFRGNEISTADTRIGQMLQQAAYVIENVVPITLGEAMSQARTGELGWSNTLTGVGAQFAGVNYNPPSPSERLHQIARETYGKEFWDLAPSEKAAIKADHSSLWLNYVAGASDMVRAAEQAKQDFLTQQATADADLLAGKIALQDWAEGLDDRRNQLIGADRVIYADLEKGGKRNPVLDSYYAAIDAANVNGSVDWTKVDAYVGGLSRQDQQYIKDNTGLTQTPLTRLRKTLQGDYYSLPRYRGYTAAEAGQVDDYYDDILNLVGTGASKGRKLAAARQVAGDADPKVLKALRMKILGYLDDTADRERWRRQHPESALIVSRGRMSAAQIAAIQAAV